jgi:hypothetical protein
MEMCGRRDHVWTGVECRLLDCRDEIAVGA